MLEIDASGAIAELGIQGEVSFIAGNLNGRIDPLSRLDIGMSSTQAFVPDWAPDEVWIDWAAIAACQHHGAESRFSDPCEVIAHELVHVMQYERDGVRDVIAAYDSGEYDYDENPYELEAFELAPRLASLIQVNLGAQHD